MQQRSFWRRLPRQVATVTQEVELHEVDFMKWTIDERNRIVYAVCRRATSSRFFDRTRALELELGAVVFGAKCRRAWRPWGKLLAMNRRMAVAAWVAVSYVLITLCSDGRETAFGQDTISTREDAEPPSRRPPLGSASFYPTAERPVGWRGDWTGRFPGATPPTQWSRRVKGITSEIKYQAEQALRRPGGRQPSRWSTSPSRSGWWPGRLRSRTPPRTSTRTSWAAKTRFEPARDAKAGDVDVEAPARGHRHPEPPLSQRRHLRRPERRFRVRLRQPARQAGPSRRSTCP